MSKKELGQFFTTNYKYILQNLSIPDNIINIIEPFTGNGDLINFLDKNKYKLECYDIEPKHNYIQKRDTLLNPPDYNNKFVLTNPPYLARNKCNNKNIFDKYDCNDLYKCFIKEIITNKCLGGIIIIPLNFWSSIRIQDIELRKNFLEVYNIVHLNIFEEQVFDDTSYTVCSFQFTPKQNIINNINISIYPSKKTIKTELNDNNNYIIGGNIYKLKVNNKYNITRLTSKNKSLQNTNILVKCIDDNSNSKLGLSYVNDEDIFIDETPKLSARTYATLVITPQITEEQQKFVVAEFNKYMDE